MFIIYSDINFLSFTKEKAQASAAIKGSEKFPEIHGEVNFYQASDKVLVSAVISGLPKPAGPCDKRIFGFHIHSGATCSGNESDPFADAMSHYNPSKCPHPYHAGDLPPLFGCEGVAFSVFLTDRFTAKEIIGKTIIIHSQPDDFTTQPSGNSGEKIACGEIV